MQSDTGFKNKFSLILIAAMLFVIGGCNIGETSKQPNIVFILVDDLGYMDLGYTGSTSYETPNIDALAASGMVFNNAYAASSICSPTRAAIMSGKSPARLHLTDYIPGNRHWAPHKDQKLASKPFNLKLDLKEFTMAEAFKDAGYRTMFAGKWHLGEDEVYYPQFQGFDINIGGNKTGHPSGGYFSPYHNQQIEDGYEGEYLTDRLTDEVIQFVNKSNNAPFFAYLSFYTVHLPLEAKPQKVEKYNQKFTQQFSKDETYLKEGNTFHKQRQNNSNYAAMVESMDENVGRLLAALEKNDLSENTIIVFTSDNGGMSTSNTIDNIPTSNWPLRAGKGYLYEGGIREPLIIKWPNLIEKGTKSDVPVISMDFFPTLLDLAGIDLIAEQHQDGISLKSVLESENSIERPLFWHYPHYSGGLGGKPSSAVQLGEYKLIENYEDNSVELYRIKTDSSETKDLSESQRELAKRLKNLLHKWKDSVAAQVPYLNPYYQNAQIIQ